MVETESVMDVQKDGHLSQIQGDRNRLSFLGQFKLVLGLKEQVGISQAMKGKNVPR